MKPDTIATLEVEAPPDRDPQEAVVVTLRDFLSREIPAREMLLSPWLTSQSLTMIHAWRGVGKTYVALGIAYALASGGAFLQWRAESPVPVLYVDGEMPSPLLKARLAAIVDAAAEEAADGYFNLMTPDLQRDGVMPNLSSPGGQLAIDRAVGDARVIVVDNISTLARSRSSENDAESWDDVAAWALQHRARGRSVVFVHHSGKGGQQRGTSKREDVLDTVINLKRPKDYRDEEGARFEVLFEKARSMYGREVRPFEARLETDTAGRQTWALRDASLANRDRAIELFNLGLTQAEIARELECERSTVLRTLRKAEDAGELTRPLGRRGRRDG